MVNLEFLTIGDVLRAICRVIFIITVVLVKVAVFLIIGAVTVTLFVIDAALTISDFGR